MRFNNAAMLKCDALLRIIDGAHPVLVPGCAWIGEAPVDDM